MTKPLDQNESSHLPHENKSKCPDANTLAAYLDETIRDDEKQLLDSHLQICPECREILGIGAKAQQGQFDQVVSDSIDDTVHPLVRKLMPFGQLTTGKTIGRYIVLKPLGLGGMGEVYLAYDPDLNRRVALKLLRTDIYLDSMINSHVARLMKEAQAMAQLSHPNVISVFDVMKVDGRVAIAMEFFSGGTLKSWLEERSRSVGEIVDVFVAAGRGLAAAHEAKLVHRDFKPANVLLGEDGRVCVTDFGLVRGLDQDRQPSSPDSLALQNCLEDNLTMTGMFMGTPAYMSPEQLLGERIDTQSDQFCFCVALFEALYGQRPYPGESIEEIKNSILAGQMCRVEALDRPPVRLYEILKRGLATNPKHRYPNMQALLDALEDDPETRARARRRKRRHRISVVVLLVLAIAAPLVVWYEFSIRRSQRCKGGTQKVNQLWNDQNKAAVKRAFLATGRSHALTTYEIVTGNLDDWSQKWIGTYTQACRATHIEGEQSETVLDLRMACLRRKLTGLRSLVGLFVKQVDSELVDRAAEASLELGQLRYCSDIEALSQETQPIEDVVTRQRVEDLQRALAQVEQLNRLGRYKRASATLERLVQRFELLLYPPLGTEVSLVLGNTYKKLGRFEKAKKEFKESLSSGLRFKQWDFVLRAMQGLATVLGVGLQQHREGMLFAELAVGMSEELHGEQKALSVHNLGVLLFNEGKYKESEQAYRRALVMWNRAKLFQHPAAARSIASLAYSLQLQGKYPEAEREYRQALDVYTTIFGPEHPEVASVRTNLAFVLGLQAKNKEAESQVRQALEQFVDTFGAENTKVAWCKGTLGVILSQLGEQVEAERELRQSILINEKGLGQTHPFLAWTKARLGGVLLAMGRYVEAEIELRRAIVIQEKVLGPNHSLVAFSRSELGNVLYNMDRYTEAESEYRQALTIKEKALGPEHPETAIDWDNLGQIMKQKGDYQKAIAYFKKALLDQERALGEEHPFVTFHLCGLGETLLIQDQPEMSVPHFERVLTICGKLVCDREVRGRGLFGLARALVAMGGNKDRAIMLAKKAKAVFEKAPKRFGKEIRETVVWLRKQR